MTVTETLPINSPVIADREHNEITLRVRILGPAKYGNYFKVTVTTAHNDFTQGWPTEGEARSWANTMWTYYVAQARSTQAQSTPAAPVEVPAGRYALEGTDGVVRFYKIDRPTEGRWAGRVFVKVLASDTEYPVRGQGARDVLSQVGADIQGASLRFGREIGSCGVCGRTLTDEDSRARGIGPKCLSNMGW